MVTLLIISTVHVRSFPYLRPPLPDSSLDESLLFCASAFWTIPWKCLKPDGIVKGNKCENLSLFYSLFFPCFFVQFFSNWQHSIIATRKFCWYYGVCDWPMLANVIISFVSTERWCYTRKATEFSPSISGLNLQGNADGGTVRSPPLHRGDSELPKSGSTIQGALRNQQMTRWVTRQTKEVFGGKTPGRSIKFGGKTPRRNLKVFPGEFWLCSELWTQLHNLDRGLDCAINRCQWALAAWTRWLESSTGSIFMEEFPCPCYESPSQSKIWFWGRRGDYKILQQYCNIWYQVDSDSVNWFQSCRVRDVSAFLCRSYLEFGTRASTSHCDPLCTSPRSGLACSGSLWALDEARSTSSCTAWLVIQDGSLVRCACAVILCSWRYVKCVFFIFQKLTIPTQVSLYLRESKTVI